MRTNYIMTESRYKARKTYPWAAKIVRVCGGYLCFESVNDYNFVFKIKDNMKKNKTIYQLAVEQMDKKDICHHESDLYLRVTNISEGLISDYELKKDVTLFADKDGAMWFDIPVAFDPFYNF